MNKAIKRPLPFSLLCRHTVTTNGSIHLLKSWIYLLDESCLSGIVWHFLWSVKNIKYAKIWGKLQMNAGNYFILQLVSYILHLWVSNIIAGNSSQYVMNLLCWHENHTYVYDTFLLQCCAAVFCTLWKRILNICFELI